MEGLTTLDSLFLVQSQTWALRTREWAQLKDTGGVRKSQSPAGERSMSTRKTRVT